MSQTATSPPKRDLILEAAVELFAEQGYHGVTVPEVADKAGVGAGTIYRYFASKEALVNEAYRLHKGQVMQAMLRALPLDKSPREQFHHLWAHAIAFARRHPKEMRFLELHHHAAYLDAESRALATQYEVLAKTFFVEASGRGFIKPVAPEMLMALIWGAFTGLMKAHWDGHLKLDDEIIAQSEQCLWEAIRA